jgi:hypothetical protein
MFSTALNYEGYNYDIYHPINLLILQLESHVSQLLGAKKQIISISPGSNFIASRIGKS